MLHFDVIVIIDVAVLAKSERITQVIDCLFSRVRQYDCKTPQ